MGRQVVSKRYIGIDLLKCLCAFLVVCIHYHIPGKAGPYLVTLARIAVPLFFMITGFFYTDVVQRGAAGKQLYKILKLVISANLLYFAWGILLRLLRNQDLHYYLAAIFSKESAVRLFMLNESPFVWHLWYLNAILYVLILAGILIRMGGMKLLQILSPILLAFTLILGRYSRLLLGQEFWVSISRNFLFAGLPYFCIGMTIKQWELKGKLVSCRPLAGVCAIGFSAASLLEHYLLEASGMQGMGDYYISTTGLAIAVFLLFLTADANGNTGRFKALAIRVGREDSTGIYVVQILVGTLLSMVLENTCLQGVYTWTAPLAVFAASLMCTSLYHRVKRCVKEAKNHNRR